MSALFEKISTPLEGLFELQPIVRGDKRGSFVKIFHADIFEELGLATDSDLRRTLRKNIIPRR